MWNVHESVTQRLIKSVSFLLFLTVIQQNRLIHCCDHVFMVRQNTVFSLWGHSCPNELVAFTHSLDSFLCSLGIRSLGLAKNGIMGVLPPIFNSRVNTGQISNIIPLRLNWKYDSKFRTIQFFQRQVATIAPLAVTKACASHCPPFLVCVPKATWYSQQKSPCLKAEILKVRSRPVRLRARCAACRLSECLPSPRLCTNTSRPLAYDLTFMAWELSPLWHCQFKSN